MMSGQSQTRTSIAFPTGFVLTDEEFGRGAIIANEIIGDDQAHVEDRLIAASRILADNGFCVLAPLGLESPVVSALTRSRLEIFSGARFLLLGQVESRLVATLLAASGSWCTREDLLRRVWGDCPPGSGSVSVHIHNLRQKLRECANASAMLETARGRGVRLDPKSRRYFR